MHSHPLERDTKTPYTVPMLRNVFHRVCACAFVVGVLLCVAAPAHAQDVPLSGASLNMQPRYPQPGEEVRVRVDSLRLDVDMATIEWYRDGVLVRSGVGEDEYTFVADANTEPTVVRVVLRSNDDITVGASATVRSTHVAVVWEANTYTPPLYGGKALLSPGASATIYAMPFVYENGVQIASDSLLFEWLSERDNATLARGMGQDTVTLQNPDPFLDLDIVLRIYDAAGELRTIRAITIPTKPPELLLYSKHVLRGILWSEPVGTMYDLTDELGELVAEPFFFSVDSRFDPNLRYEWEVGNQTLDTPGSIFLAPEGEGRGSSRITLSLRHEVAWRQRADTRTVASFDTTSAPERDRRTTDPL